MKTCLFVLLLLNLSAHAEVYRWTDSDGKVHYGDKKPKAPAEDITQDVKKTNVDTSSAEHQKLEKVFRKENDADREYKAQQSLPDPILLQRCEKAKEYIRLENRPIQFYDDEGKIRKVSEADRQKHDAETREFIKNNCSS